MDTSNGVPAAERENQNEERLPRVVPGMQSKEPQQHGIPDVVENFIEDWMNFISGRTCHSL
jgi:hypothetical protein